MNRTDRLSAILIMLQTKKLITAREISERFDISLRTVYRDMKALDEAGVPLGAEVGSGYYLVEGYHLPPVMFTPEEAGSMLIAGKLVDKFSDQSVKSYFNLAIDKIKSVLPDSHRDFISQMEGQVHIFHNTNILAADFSNNYITTIQKAMSAKKCLNIRYFSKYNNSSNSREIEPLGLCFYGFKWHLIGYCYLRNDFRDFRLDRLQELEISERPMEHDKNFSIGEYFQNSFENEEVFNLTVRFNKDKVSSLNSSRYYFGFYEELVTKDYVEMKFAVNEYEYIAGWLMSLGDMVQEILNTKMLEYIQQQVAELSKQYLGIKV